MQNNNKQKANKHYLKFILVIISLILIIIAIKPSSVQATPCFIDAEIEEYPFLGVQLSVTLDKKEDVKKDVSVIINTDKYVPKQEEPIIEEIKSETENDIPNNETNNEPAHKNPNVQEDNKTQTPPQKEPSEEKPPEEEKPNYSDNFVGRFKIPSLGVNVACYSGSAQSIVDASDSAAYFYAHGHAIIADHKHQGFNAIKSATTGTKATLGSTEYKCVAKIKGHNTGHSITDANGKVITNLYPGTLVTYTCNENWQNITIVFWECVDKDDSIDCSKGLHLWNDWVVAWELYDKNGNYYGWDKKVCKLCGEEEWEPRKTPSENCPPPEITEPEDPTEPEVTEPEDEIPEETIPTESTTPPEVTEPKETTPPDEITPPTESSATTEPSTEGTEPNPSDKPDNVVEVIG